MAIDVARWQFTIADYARMREVGILNEDDRVELLDGEVRPMSPIGPFHAALVNLLVVLLSRQLGDRAIVSVQNPIQLNDYSEPQPDLSILQPREDFYAAAHPRPDDVLIVIEVADSSIEYDHTEKLPRYAQAGIAEVWIVDAAKQAVEQYTHPRNGRYHQIQLAERGEQVTAYTIDQVVLSIDSLFR
jgi:Uma2 family endonuclease